MLSGLSSQAYDITADGFANAHMRCSGSQLFEFAGLQNWHAQVLVQPSLRCIADCHESRQLVFVVRCWVVHANFYEKAIFLGLRERIRALMLDWILRCKDDKDRGERAGLAIDRHLALLHR